MVERPREFEPHTPQQLFALREFDFFFGFFCVVLLLVPALFSMLISKQNRFVNLASIFYTICILTYCFGCLSVLLASPPSLLASDGTKQGLKRP